MSATEMGMERDSQPEEARRQPAWRETEGGEAATLEREIDATRAEVRATLEALESRLSVERLLQLTVGKIRERGGEFAGNLGNAATQNPIPLLLASIGVGWMMLESRRGTLGRPGRRAGGPRARSR